MTRLAIVVQRCHADVVGGSEALAWQYAQLLGERYDVDILTSCALDYRTWRNELPAGVETRDGVAIHRFESAWPRGRWFGDLHRRLLATYRDNAQRGVVEKVPWRPQLAEEFIRAQGPWCPGLIDHLAERHDDYAAIVFCTYLYPTTYYGMAAVPRAKRVLVPTLHDEPPAYLPVFARAARETANIVWLTQAERALGRRLWNVEHGDVVGMAVASAPAQPERRDVPYLLYCGRIDEAKGCRELIDAFVRCKREHRAPLDLVLTGSDHIGLPARDDVQYLGYVDDARKAALMAGAAAFVMPSPYESFSIVTLEAMAQGTPVIANGDCDVLAEHIARSGAGWTYRGREALVACMRDAVATPQRAELARRGADYVAANYSIAATRERLRAAIDGAR